MKTKQLRAAWYSHWRRWRRWYDNRPYNPRRDYPAKRVAELVNRPHLVRAFPVANPELGKNFNVPV